MYGIMNSTTHDTPVIVADKWSDEVMDKKSVIGELEVTITYRVKVTDLEHFDATDMQMARDNLDTWYHDGSAEFELDMSDVPVDIQVRVVENTE